MIIICSSLRKIPRRRVLVMAVVVVVFNLINLLASSQSIVFFSFRLFFSTEQHSNHPLCHSFAISLFTLFSIQSNLSISYLSPCCCLLSLRLGRIPAATYYTHPLPPLFFFKSLFSSCKSLIFLVVHALDRLICLYLYLYLYLYPCYPRILNPF